jgi:hypothetical protein
MLKILALVLFLICFPLLACRPSPVDLAKEVAEADVVAIAYITGIFSPDAEAVLLNDLDEPSEEIECRIIIPVQKSVRLITERSLKGTANKINQTTTGCSFHGELMDRIILLKKDSRVWVRHLDAEARQVLKSLEQ